jgi:hypothetical protein
MMIVFLISAACFGTLFFLMPPIFLNPGRPSRIAEIPPLAWVAIAILVLFTLAVNIAMIALLRARTRPDQANRQLNPGGFIGAAQNLAKMSEVMRDPFAKDQRQLEELAQLVRHLEEESKNPDQPADRQEADRLEAARQEAGENTEE